MANVEKDNSTMFTLQNELRLIEESAGAKIPPAAETTVDLFGNDAQSNREQTSSWLLALRFNFPSVNRRPLQLNIFHLSYKHTELNKF